MVLRIATGLPGQDTRMGGAGPQNLTPGIPSPPPPLAASALACGRPGRTRPGRESA